MAEPQKEAPSQEASAVELLRLGARMQEIAKRLQQRGMSQAEAEALAERVWRDNVLIRRTNSLILMIVGAIILVLGILSFFSSGVDILNSFFVAMGAFICVRGIGQYWTLSQRPN